MKKFFLFLLVYSIPLFGANSFWQELIEVQNKFFSKNSILTMISVDGNITKALDENRTSSLFEERIHAYEGLVIKLKNEPYTLEKRNNPFYDPKKNEKEINTLLLKIDSNRKLGYLQAVKRDKLKLQTLKLKGEIYQFLLYLADKWTNIDEQTLIEKIEKTSKAVKENIPIKDIISTYEEIAPKKGTIVSQTKKNFFELAKNYYFFDTFLDYLRVNAKILTYHSIASELQLDDLITYINKQPLFAKANTYLRYLKLDVGRLVLFLFIILFFWMLNYLVYKKLYNYFKSKILQDEDESDDILIDNLDRIRRPVSLLINGIGLQLALEVVNYPQPLSDKTTLFFHLFFIAIVAYILMQLIENIFFVYFQHQRLKNNKELRAELVNLMLSITKIIIFLGALLIAFVKMGVNITGLLASLGIGGLAVALAAQTTLSNFFGLLKIIFDESFSQGDWISTNDVEGTVVEIGFISTKIRTFDNALITVPNAELANKPLKNWNKRTIGRRIKMHLGVTYGAKRENIKSAIDEITQMLKDHPGIISPEKIDKRSMRKRYKESGKFLSMEDKLGIKSTMLVYLDKFSDSSIDILIYTFTKTTNWQDWLDIKEDLLYKVWQILEKHDLEFAFPSQTLYFDKENISENLSIIENKKLL